MTIAIDFDGTIVEHRYPKIGNEIPFAIDTLKMLLKAHHRLILWTVREGNCWTRLWNGAGNGAWNFMPSTVTTPKRTSPITVSRAK